MESVMGFGGIEGAMFNVIPYLVTAMFIIVFVMILVRMVQGAKQWHKNNESPVLTVVAHIVAKRTAVQHYNNNTQPGVVHDNTCTSYYVTFEVESGDRMEFHIKSTEYGLLAEGDRGQLTFQGTRYLGFERSRG